MCAGDDYPITGSYEAGSEIEMFHLQSTLSIADTAFLPDGVPCTPYGCSYRSNLTFTDYHDGDVVESVDDIYYVRIKLEHSYIGDLYINITCPNGQKADIMRWSGNGSTQCSNLIPQSSRDCSPEAIPRVPILGSHTITRRPIPVTGTLRTMPLKRRGTTAGRTTRRRATPTPPAPEVWSIGPPMSMAARWTLPTWRPAPSSTILTVVRKPDRLPVERRVVYRSDGRLWIRQRLSLRLGAGSDG